MFLSKFLILCFIGLYACDQGPTQSISEPSGETSILIPLGKISASSISSAEIVITATGMNDRKEALTVDGNYIGGTITDIPAGEGRVFTINCYDSSGNLTYTGSRTATVLAGEQVIVQITLRRSGSQEGSLVLVGDWEQTRGYYVGRWETTSCGDDIRLRGEFLNNRKSTARSVTISITVREGDGFLLGKLRRERVTIEIQPGDSDLVVLYIKNVLEKFPGCQYAYNLRLKIETEIHDD